MPKNTYLFGFRLAIWGAVVFKVGQNVSPEKNSTAERQKGVETAAAKVKEQSSCTAGLGFVLFSYIAWALAF